MNLLKSLLAGSTSEEREWLRKPSLDCSQSPRRASKARLSFGKSLSKGSLKDSKSSVNSSDSGNTPIPRTKSKSQMFRNKKKSQVSNGASPEPRSNRNSGVSQHLEPFTLNYDCLDATEEAPPSRALRDNELFRSRRISSPPNHLTSADVSLPLRRDSPSLPNTWWSACCVVLFQYIRCYFVWIVQPHRDTQISNFIESSIVWILYSWPLSQKNQNLKFFQIIQKLSGY